MKCPLRKPSDIFSSFNPSAGEDGLRADTQISTKPVADTETLDQEPQKTLPPQEKLFKAQEIAKKTNSTVYVQQSPQGKWVVLKTNISNPKAMEVGVHGPILKDYRHDAKGAIKALMQLKTGEALAALHHKDVPGEDIDLIWGKDTGKQSTSYGLVKVIKYHPEIARDHEDLQLLLDKMYLYKKNKNTIWLKLNDPKADAVIRLNWAGKEKRWLLTAYTPESKKPSSAGRTMDISSNPETGQQDDTAPLLNGDSINNIQNKQSDVQEKSGENDVEVQFQVDTDEKSRMDKKFINEVESDIAIVGKILDSLKKNGHEIAASFFGDIETRIGDLTSEINRDIVAAEVKQAKVVYDARGMSKEARNDALTAMVAAEAAIRKAQWYENNRAEALTWLERQKNNAINIWVDVRGHSSDAMRPITTAMRKIDPEIKREVRGVFFRQFSRSADMKNQIMPMLEKMKKLKKDNPADYRDLNFALFNGDFTQAESIIKKHGIQAEYAVLRGVLDTLNAMSKAVGMEIADWGGDKGYWPRRIKDVKSFLRYVYSLEDWPLIDKAIKEKEKRIQRDMTDEEKAKLANSLLRGFRVSGLMLAKPGYAKERSVDIIGAKLIEYYASPEESIISHIIEANQKIAVREFFGRETKELVKLRAQKSRILTRLNKLSGKTSGKVWTIRHGWKELGEQQYQDHISEARKKLEDIDAQIAVLNGRKIEESIGWYVKEAVASGKLKPDVENSLTNLLVGAFDQKGIHGIAKIYSNFTYATTLGSPTSALKQLSEMALSFYRSPRFAATAAVKAVLGTVEIKPSDIGIESVGDEFTSSNLSKITSGVLKGVGFEWMDMLGKKTYINTVLNKYRHDAKNNTHEEFAAMAAGSKPKSEFYERIEKVFGDKTLDIIKEIASGEITENVKLLLFNEISDIQPVSVAEMPLAYARGGNYRIIYMMKSFIIRQLDFWINECFTDLKSPKTAVRGVKKLIKAAFLLSLFGASTDALKDLLLGREFNLSDSVVDSLSQYVFWSRYKSYQMRRKGFGGAMLESLLPVSKTIDTMTNSKENDWIRNLPYGEVFYWWFGKTSRKKRGW